MTFLIRPARRLRKQKGKNAQEVLDRLKSYLEGNYEEPVRILCGFWKDQQGAISYQELREAVLAGMLDEETFRLWSQDYSVLAADKFKVVWEEAFLAGSFSQPFMDEQPFVLSMNTPEVFNWISGRGAEFVTVSSLEQKKAIQAMLSRKMTEHHTVDELSRMIRPCIGLTEGQVKANARFYENIVSTLREEHPRMKAESIRRRALEASTKYAERQHRQRAMTIAQTEMAFAYNRGADEGIRQAQEQGLIGIVKKRWSTSGDDGVCDICNSLDGVEVDMDMEFSFKGKILFPGQHMLPPAHPRCACAVEYIEVNDKNADALLGVGSSHIDSDSTMQKLGEIDVENTDEAIDYYNDVIRNRENENVIVIDKLGNVYYAEGSTSNVNIGGVNLTGASITHNHPMSNGIVSFGKDDFEFLMTNPDIRELQAVNHDYTYRVRVLSDISRLSYDMKYLEVLKSIEDPQTFKEDLQHMVFEALDKEGYVQYARKKID